jgi:DnaK suppressor protein
MSDVTGEAPGDDFPVRDGEEPWTSHEIAELTAELSAEVERLSSELTSADAGLTELLRNSGDGAGDDQADSGSSAVEREQELTLVNNTRDLLLQNQRALERITARTYGICEACDQPIGKARLQAFPRGLLCMECKQREERR